MDRFLEEYGKLKNKDPRLAKFYLALHYIAEGYGRGKALKLAKIGSVEFYKYARKRRFRKLLVEAENQGFLKAKEKGYLAFEIEVDVNV